MDTLEAITVETSLADELEFLKFARRNRDVQIISTHATLKGPGYLSLADIPRLRSAGSPDDRTFLLWNTSIVNPLCWSLFLTHYDSDWMPIDPNYATPLKYPHSSDESLALHLSLKGHPLTQRIFRYGKIDSLLSPVIEVSIPSDNTNEHYFIITADFSNWVNGVWVVWNAFEERWEYETRNLEVLLNSHFEQLPEFIYWQELLFNWIRKNWASQIIPSWTYRYGTGA